VRIFRTLRGNSPFEDDGGRFIGLELGSFDEIRKVGFEEGQVTSFDFSRRLRTMRRS
jgi:hypothetical protein